MALDIWFAKDSHGQLWLATARPDEPPYTQVRQVKDVKAGLDSIKARGTRINMVCICDPEMLGI